MYFFWPFLSGAAGVCSVFFCVFLLRFGAVVALVGLGWRLGFAVVESLCWPCARFLFLWVSWFVVWWLGFLVMGGAFAVFGLVCLVLGVCWVCLGVLVVFAFAALCGVFWLRGCGWLFARFVRVFRGYGDLWFGAVSFDCLPWSCCVCGRCWCLALCVLGLAVVSCSVAVSVLVGRFVALFVG